MDNPFNEDLKSSLDGLDTEWIGTEVGAALAHANGQVENLFREIREWNAQHPVTMRAVFDDRGRSLTFVVDRADTPPLMSWTQQTGDVLHNWRRMLDSIAWDLSERYVREPLTKRQRSSVKFPLALAQDDLDRQVTDSHSWLSALETEYVDRLAKTQPFVAHNPKQSILRWLQDLDNQRKHRGGIRLEEVLDHTEGFLFMKLADDQGEDVNVSERSLVRLSADRKVIPGLPVLKINHRGIATAKATKPVPVSLSIYRDELESDLERMLLSLSQQLVATIMVIYTGNLPPPNFFIEEGSYLANRIGADGTLGEWGV